ATLPKLDQVKLNRLFGLIPNDRGVGPRLNPLNTDRFVVQNGPPTPEHQLDPNNKTQPPALVIEIKYDSGTTRSLTIGARHTMTEAEAPVMLGRTVFFAAASTVPNAVFVLDEMTWKDLAAGVDYLKATDRVSIGQ